MNHQQPTPTIWTRLGLGIAHLSIGTIIAWLLAWQLLGDQWWWLFMLTSVAYVLWFPLPLVLLIAWRTRRRWLGLSALVLCALGGGLFYGNPLPAPAVQAAGPTISIMTYNSLGFNRDRDQAIELLANSGADVIGIQELSDSLAVQIARDLRQQYPYQWLMSDSSVLGMGIISRYPFEQLATLDGNWAGRPQLIRLNVQGQSLRLLNFHAFPPLTPFGEQGLDGNIAERERQAAQIASLARQSPEPFVALGDFNATERHEAYQIVTSSLRDAWREAGHGLGHTWPEGQLSLAGRLLADKTPSWWVRIDYLFHTADIQTLEVQVAAHGAGSDHRAVQATFALNNTR